MLFFRSEELLDQWCRSANLPRRPVISLTQLWNLSRAWYAGRLDPEGRRPTVAEMPGIFAGAGLVGPFWAPPA